MHDKKLAYYMLLPTVLIVLSIVLFPLLVNIWISFKSIKLSDLRSPRVFASENIRGTIKKQGDEGIIRYRLRNSSQEKPIQNVRMEDTIPKGLRVTKKDSRCLVNADRLSCNLGNWEPKQSETIRISVVAEKDFDEKPNPRHIPVTTSGDSVNALMSLNFTLKNFVKVFENDFGKH